MVQICSAILAAIEMQEQNARQFLYFEREQNIGIGNDGAQLDHKKTYDNVPYHTLKQNDMKMIYHDRDLRDLRC
jgi:hypothetical protein